MAGQGLGNHDPRYIGAGDAKRPAVLCRGLRLGVVGLQLAGTAIEPEEDDRGVVGGGTLCAEPQQVSQGQTGQAKEACLESTAPGQAGAVASGSSLCDLQHRCGSSPEVREVGDPEGS